VLDWLRILGSIILIDLVLSGDNALVIGAVASGLGSNLRWVAFVVGGGGAILTRISLTYFFTILLQVPYLETIGAILLLIIAVRLLLQSPEEQSSSTLPLRRERNNALTRFMKRHHMLMAILTIFIADVTTSLDNIVAIAALARDNTTLLITGLLLSVTLLLIGSAIISRLIERLPWLILIASAILGLTAAQLIVQDHNFLDQLPHWIEPAIYITVMGLMCIPGFIWLRNYISNISSS
jgi:YjbE family integral membrane protein